MLNVQIDGESVTIDRVLYCKQSSKLILYNSQFRIAAIPPQCEQWLQVASAIQNWRSIRLSSRIEAFSE